MSLFQVFLCINEGEKPVAKSINTLEFIGILQFRQIHLFLDYHCKRNKKKDSLGDFF